MMINKIIPSVDYSQWLKRLDTQFNESTTKNFIKVPKDAVESKNKKTFL